ncbi:MAG: FapA family protein [Lachnospiraceae bacterium]|nr:FapA family protein [Lachnospiraceae bacterium]
MNGYFKMTANSDGLFLQIIAPTDGGNPTTTQMVLDYLDMHKLKGDPVLIDKAIKAADGNYVRIALDRIHPVSESYRLDIADDKMSAVAYFYPPMDKAEAMNAAELLGDLKYHKILFGIKKENIENYFKNRQYCTEIVLAEGKAPRDGEDAEVTYHFNTDLHAKPTMNADGTVDYYHLNLINHCKEGDELATLKKEDLGDNGMNIFGDPVKPRKVKVLALHPGKNTRISEDKLHLFANKTGHAILEGEHVTVSDVMQVENVDLSTGNIEYEGSVEVKGVVADGFEVKCGGNLLVKGIVEGAKVEAGGDVILERGVNGMGHGQIKAERNIVTKFIENATITAGGSVTSESIIHASVSAGTEITVSGKRGNITGGHLSATEQIEAKTIGSEMGGSTIIEVGVNPRLKEEIKEKEMALANTEKNLNAIEPTIAGFSEKLKKGFKPTPDQVQYLQKLLAMDKALKADREEKNKELDKLHEELLDVKKANVRFTGVAYPGTQIMIGSLSQTLKKEYKYGKFFSDGGDVRYTSL